jgi:RNA polymerase sigma-70 factor (ECF subfamily)
MFIVMDEIEAWISQAQQGDDVAFGKLVEHYHDRLYNQLYRVARNHEDAKELCQQTWVKVWNKLDTFRGDAAFFSWVYRIGTYTALDLLRKKKRKAEVEYLEEWGAERNPDDVALRPAAVQPDKAMEQSEIMETFREALEKISPAHREALILREVEGLSYEEIAKMAGVKKGTVMSRIFNARKSIQHYMEDVK